MPLRWHFDGRAGSCDIAVGVSIREAWALRPALVVADEAVCRLHRNKLPDAPLVELEAREELKNLGAVERIYDALYAARCRRDGLLLAVGGGLVCDVAGFAAATWMRGIDFALAPTTVLAQADAGVGGKTGVNYRGRKNLVGAFRQPRACLCDPTVLATLPEREYRSGFAEIVKHGAIADPELLVWLERSIDAIERREPGALERAVARSLELKLGVVGRDEFESGERMVLNFGHTLGHALESAALGDESRALRHGEAVSIGMAFATRLSVRRGLLGAPEAERLANLLRRLGLPTQLEADPESLVAALAHDKKRRGAKLTFVLLEGLGAPRLTDVAVDEVEEALRDLR